MCAQKKKYVDLYSGVHQYQNHISGLYISALCVWFTVKIACPRDHHLQFHTFCAQLKIWLKT